MSLNYGTLKAAVLSIGHRPDLTVEVIDFVRRAEGMIRRNLRAYPLSYTLTDSDRVSGGIYTFPSGFLEDRAIYTSDAQGNSYQIEKVGVRGIREELDASSPAIQFAIRGTQIEFRGAPGTGASLELLYLGSPVALASDADTNTLLADHEALYIDGALYQLYTFTEDLELAGNRIEAFTDAIERLNEQLARKFGGTRPNAAFDFSPSGSY